MNKIYNVALRYMELSIDDLASRVKPPVQVQYADSFVYRYQEKTIHQALVQKLARQVSSLHAARLLMEHGFFQEQAAMQRMLDELTEDIHFLSRAVTSGEVTQLHLDYLDAFYEEEFDNERSSLASTQKRPMIPRRKIQAYNANSEGSTVDPSTRQEAARTISKAYSGYVHGASPHIMDMYGGEEPKFHVRGMSGTDREITHREDLTNYFYRAIASFAFGYAAFGDIDRLNAIRAFANEFAQHAGFDDIGKG